MPEAAATPVADLNMHDISNALSTLRETVEKNIKSDSEIKEITEKCNKRLDELDAANTVTVTAKAEKEKKQ